MKQVLLLYHDMPDDAYALLRSEVRVIGPLYPTDPWQDALGEADGIVTNVQYKFTPDVLDRVTRARVIGRPASASITLTWPPPPRGISSWSTRPTARPCPSSKTPLAG
jgi:phosphoglycerate dehydrogenase-like enzyme